MRLAIAAARRSSMRRLRSCSMRMMRLGRSTGDRDQNQRRYQRQHSPHGKHARSVAKPAHRTLSGSMVACGGNYSSPTPFAIIAACRLFCSDEASYNTGTTLTPDGGFTLTV